MGATLKLQDSSPLQTMTRSSVLTVMHTTRDPNFESFSITDDRIADSLPDALLENDKTTSMISFKICDCLEGQGGTMPGMCAMFGAPSGVGHSGLPRDHSRYLRSGSNIEYPLWLKAVDSLKKA